jgi:hypothetical protein
VVAPLAQHGKGGLAQGGFGDEGPVSGVRIGGHGDGLPDWAWVGKFFGSRRGAEAQRTAAEARRNLGVFVRVAVIRDYCFLSEIWAFHCIFSI